MDVPQGNFLYRYLKQAKMSIIFFLSQNGTTEGQNRSCLRGLLPVGEGGGRERV
jgi:hypothetical protein